MRVPGFGSEELRRTGQQISVILYNPANGNSGTWATGSGGNVAPSSLQDIGEAGANMYFSTNPSTNVFGHWIADAEL